MVYKEKQPLIKSLNWWSISLAITTVAGSVVSFYILSKSPYFTSKRPPQKIPHDVTPAINAVAALGRLEPQGEVIHLSASDSLGRGVRIAKLLIKKGDRLKQEQIVAILDSYDSHLAALEKAQKQVQVSQAILNKVKAGAKKSDIYAQQAAIANIEAELGGQIRTQKATIARIETDLKNAELENQRYQNLYREGAVAATVADTKRLRVDTVQQQLAEAKATLNRTVETLQKQSKEAKARLVSIAEIRPTDVQAAEIDVESAKASIKQAQADLDLSYVRSPIDGQVLKINTWTGEIISSKGIADLGRTQQMYVVAEVYQTDIEKVRIGQSAIITSDAFSGKLQGTVTDIGLQVGQQNIFINNPGADTDNKIVDVKIRIDNPSDSQKVAGLTNLQVQVLIQIH